MFQDLTTAPPDPILGLNESFAKDPNPEKINLSVGVYQDGRGITPVLKCVKDAEQRLVNDETSKSYLAIAGIAQYNVHVQQLLFGADHPVVAESRAGTIQTPGGTAALRVAGDFLRQTVGPLRVWCSRPTWENHGKVFQAAGLEVASYAYLDASGHWLDFDAMYRDLSAASAGDVVVLHVCCHNPTGVDPDETEWRQIAQLIAARGVVPLLDFAYQGFGEGLEPDRRAVTIMAEPVPELLVASSFSKNFGLYCERVGALTVVTASAGATQAAVSHLKRAVRANYSNPPAHGGAIVATVLGDPQLRARWLDELDQMRNRIQSMRQLLATRLAEFVPQRDFSFIQRQRGMFSYSGLAPDEVDRLREEFSIYIVRSGRINVAGITERNVDRLCAAIAKVVGG